MPLGKIFQLTHLNLLHKPPLLASADKPPQHPGKEPSMKDEQIYDTPRYSCNNWPLLLRFCTYSFA